MTWNTFAYVVVPTGAALIVMLVSGFQSLVGVADMLLKAPLRIKNAQISLAMFMTGFCGILVTLSYSSLRRAEESLRHAERNRMTMVQGLDDQLHRNIFYQGRNFWLSVAGLVLWGVAWRLKALFDSGTLVVHKPRRKSSLRSRFVYAAVALLCLGLADIPMCRLNYSLQLSTFVTPKKTSLLGFGAKNGCENAKLGAAQGACEELCRETKSLCDDRLWAINWARNWHVFGRVAAEAFDGTRNVQQGQARIEKLFEDRPCMKVLQSVDKSNSSVNYMCGAFAGISIIGFLVAIQNMISVGDDTSLETTVPGIQGTAAGATKAADSKGAAGSAVFDNSPEGLVKRPVTSTGTAKEKENSMD